AARRRHVCRETRLRLLDNLHRVTVALQNIGHRLPSGTVGEGAVDQDDGLDGRMGRGCGGKSNAGEKSQNQTFHDATPLMLAPATKHRGGWCTKQSATGRFFDNQRVSCPLKQKNKNAPSHLQATPTAMPATVSARRSNGCCQAVCGSSAATMRTTAVVIAT